MAVEPVRVQGRLKALFPKANLSKKRLDELSARLSKRPADDATDEQIDEVINSANEIFPFEEIAKEDDRKATYISQLEELKRRRSGASDADQDDDDSEDTDQDDDAPAWAKAQFKAINALKEEMESFKTGRVIETKTNNARSLFDKNPVFSALPKNIQDHYFKQIDVKSEELDIEEQIQGLESIHKELVQTTADSTKFAGAPPMGTGGKEAPTKEELDAVIDSM